MAENTPGTVRALAAFTRWIVQFLGEYVADERQMAALRAELGLPPAPYNAASIAEMNQRLAVADARLKEGAESSDEDLSLDEGILDLLQRGKAFAEAVEIAFQGRYDGDLRSSLDIATELFGILTSERLRTRWPLAWVALRALMFGYEKAEEIPRFDPIAIYDRLTGGKTKVADNPFGWVELVGGMVVPAVAVLINQLLLKPDPVRIGKLKEGQPYLVGEIGYTVGWETDPQTDAAVQNLLARAVTLRFTGAQKTKGTTTSNALSLILSSVLFKDVQEGDGVFLRVGADFKSKIDFAPKGPITRTLEAGTAGTGALDMMFTPKPRFLGAAEDATIITAKYSVTGLEDSPAFRVFGKPGKSRLDVVGYGFGGELSEHTQAVSLSATGAKLTFYPGEITGGFFHDLFSAINAEKFEARVEGALKLDFDKGFTFEGEAGLKARVLSSKNLADVARIDYLDVGLGLKDDKVALSVEAAARFKIATFTASIDRFGVKYLIGESVEAIPPRGIGLRLDGGPIKGGGFLMLDFDAGEFAGAMELTVAGFSLKAIAILSTGGKNSNVDFALFVLIYARFPNGLQVGLGFTLNALGGIIGVNHGFDDKALVDALPNGAMDDVLFPEDPVGDAPRIISSLKTIFPTKSSAYVIGIMAEAGWGTDRFCAFRLGLIFPIGEEVRGEKGFYHIHILGRMSVICFEHVPKAIRLQLIADFVGKIGFGERGISVSFFVQLRDSRFGPTAITGGIAFSARTGPNARFLVAAGGFHPSFKEIPDDLPAQIDRIGANYDIGVIRAWIKAYFAVASGSLQFGVEVGVRYKLGPIAFRAELGLDALIHLDPFSFEAGARASAALTYRGHELLGIHLSLTIWGPDRWRIKGRGEFSILFWDIDVNVDESWGDDVTIEQISVALGALVLEDLRNDSNWRYEIAGNATLVTIDARGKPGEKAPNLVHPLSSISYTQRRVPFGLQLEHVSFCPIVGPTLFPVPRIASAVGAVPGTKVMTDQFAVPEFIKLTDEQRFSRPSFETLPAGVSAGAADYVVPDGVADTPIECELIFSRTAGGGVFPGLVEFEGFGMSRFAAYEAAARAPVRPIQVKRPEIGSIRTNPPTWAAADRDSLQFAEIGGEAAWASQSAAAMTAMVGANFNVVESFELAG